MAFLKDWIQYAAGAIINVKHCVGFHNVLFMDIVIKITCKICSFTYILFKNWFRNVCKVSEGEVWHCIMYFFCNLFVMYCTLMIPCQNICHENIHKRTILTLLKKKMEFKICWIIWIMDNNWKWKSCFKTRLSQFNDRLKTWQNKWQISITHIHMPPSLDLSLQIGWVFWDEAYGTRMTYNRMWSVVGL